MNRLVVVLLASVIATFSLASPAVAAVNSHTNANLAFISGGDPDQRPGAGGRTATFPAGYQTTGGSGITRSGGNCAVINGQYFCHGKGYTGREQPG